MFEYGCAVEGDHAAVVASGSFFNWQLQMHRFLVPGLLTVGTLPSTRAAIEWASTADGHQLIGERMALAESAYDIVPGTGSETRRPDNYGQCVWGPSGSHKYDFAITKDNKDSDGETSRTECFANVFEAGKALAYPFPRSSYHYDTDPNHAITEDSLDKPHISLDIEFDVSKNNGASVVDTQYFDFENFETNAASILYKSTGHSAGRYKYNLKAYDFEGVDSKDCSTCLSVTDMYRPTGIKGSCQNAYKDGFTKANVDELKYQVDKLVEYRQKADNNKCSDDRCDALGLVRTNFFGVESERDSKADTKVDDALQSWKSCLSDALTDAEWAKLTTSVFATSPSSPSVFTCARSCKYDVTLKEFYTPYSCATDYGVEGQDRRQCAGDATQFCNFTQTVTAKASDLVSKVQVALKPSPVKPPIADPKTVFPGSTYDAPSTTSKELHFDVTCDNNAPEFATYCTSQLQVKVSDLFQLEATLNTDNDAVKALLVNRSTTTANPIVFWRVKNTLAGTWQEISSATGDLKDSKAVLTFPQFKSELIFEAYTACGKVGDSITWTIYVHRTEVVHIDDWWYSMWDCGAAGKCNVEHTDFRVCKFKFDPQCDTYLSMLNPSDAKNIPIDPLTNDAYKVCEYKDENKNKKTCSEGCWWHYASCDTASSEEACTNRIREEGSRFVYCGKDGAHAPQVIEQETLAMQMLLQDTLTTTAAPVSTTAAPVSSTAAPVSTTATPSPVEVRIKWQFYGMTCSWKYQNSKAAAPFLSTALLGTAQPAFNKEVAIKMQNVDVTEVTVSCDFFFKSNAAAADVKPTKRSRSKTVLIQNCDHPRWNAERPTDQGRYIKDTCDVVSWYSDITGLKPRQPAPFQACKGALVYPSDPSIEDGKATTIYVETNSTGLTCCNPKAPTTVAPFTCQTLPGSTSIGLCTDSKDPNIYYTRSVKFFGESMADAAQSYARELLVAGGLLAAVAVVAAVSAKKTSAAGVDLDDAYMQLLA
ncbi:hypothetical protein DYB30_007855 [Aphanomyces astaci]|uniref:Uncharacterized protein n=2 Tax=Aphanomyces astaci TaxID=112090 RepID=A0A397DKN8_APHAT|nr:hypothetical protein DYB30_007855 [Aphanomyces astaci]